MRHRDPTVTAFALSLILLLTWFLITAAYIAGEIAERRSKRTRKFRFRTGPRPDIPWEKRFSEADAIIRELIADLPPEIRTEAERVPFLLQEWPPNDASPRMGVYLSFERAVVSSTPGPIIIYIGPHHDYCARYKIDYAEEIRRTDLHELGHHLGLDEGDLEERGIG